MIGSHNDDELGRLFRRFYEWVIRAAFFLGGILFAAALAIFL